MKRGKKKASVWVSAVVLRWLCPNFWSHDRYWGMWRAERLPGTWSQKEKASPPSLRLLLLLLLLLLLPENNRGSLCPLSGNGNSPGSSPATARNLNPNLDHSRLTKGTDSTRTLVFKSKLQNWVSLFVSKQFCTETFIMKFWIKPDEEENTDFYFQPHTCFLSLDIRKKRPFFFFIAFLSLTLSHWFWQRFLHCCYSSGYQSLSVYI